MTIRAQNQEQEAWVRLYGWHRRIDVSPTSLAGADGASTQAVRNGTAPGVEKSRQASCPSVTGNTPTTVTLPAGCDLTHIYLTATTWAAYRALGDGWTAERFEVSAGGRSEYKQGLIDGHHAVVYPPFVAERDAA